MKAYLLTLLLAILSACGGGDPEDGRKDAEPVRCAASGCTR